MSAHEIESYESFVGPTRRRRRRPILFSLGLVLLFGWIAGLCLGA